MNEIPTINDFSARRKHRARAIHTFHHYDFLYREGVERLMDRLGDTTRRFSHALVLGAHQGRMRNALQTHGVDHVVEQDIVAGMLSSKYSLSIIMEEEKACFAEDIFDLIIAPLSLHWVNDLPGTLVQIRRMLRPDGLFLAMMPGGQTLQELRDAMACASSDQGGMSARIVPFIDVRDAGGLLQRAGFALPVVDSDVLHVTYEHPFKLMQDLRGMGEGNALQLRQKHFTTRGFMQRVVAHYSEQYSNAEGRVNATFELVTLTGWKPHSSQQQPARRGSGQMNLKQVL